MRHSGALDATLWQSGLLAAGERKLHGAAVIKAQAVIEAGLSVAASEPPPRHAVITNWFWDDGEPAIQKARQKEHALILSAGAKVVLRDL